MKKTLLMAAILTLGATTVAYAGCPCGNGQCGCPAGAPPKAGKPCVQRPGNFQRPPRVNMDEKLNLTDDQKAKAKELRMQGREQMRPIMEAIRTKQEQKALIKRSTDITTEAKLEQIEKLNNQINALHKQAHDLRLKNERDFEAILTSKQKKELDKIKSEAKANAQKNAQKCAPKNAPKAFTKDSAPKK